MSYWDTSALVKLFAAEGDSPSFHAHAASIRGLLVTAEFTRLELWITLRRKEAEGLLHPDEARGLLADFDSGTAQNEWRLVPDSVAVRTEFERIVEQCYSRTPPVFLRTLDALHIAAASAAGEAEIVATDRRLREAETLLGFQLFPEPMP